MSNFQPESYQRGQIQRLILAEVKSSSQLVVARFSHDIKPNYNLNQFFCFLFLMNPYSGHKKQCWLQKPELMIHQAVLNIQTL